MKKYIIIILAIVSIFFACAALSACGGEEEETYSTLEMEEGIVYLTDFSIIYTAAADSPNGDINQGALSEAISGTVQSYYLVMNFDMQMASEILKMEYITVEFTVLNADVVQTIVNYANTSSTSVVTEDGQATITATYSLPDKAKLIKNVQLVLELKPKSIGGTDILYSLSTDNKQITGYTSDDITYKRTNSAVSIKKSSLEYTLNDDGAGYSVTGIGSKSGSTYIKNTYNGLPVTAIGDYAFANSDLISLIIPDSVTSVGSGAFYNCAKLAKVNIPQGVTEISDYTFYSCSSLTGLDLPDGMTSVGDFAFYGCTLLESLDIPEKVTTVGGYAFYNCAKLANVNIPQGVTKISDYTFYSCSSLAGLDLPDGVTSIGNYAFYGCTLLESLEIPEGVTTIGGYAFYNCAKLANVNIPQGVTEILDYTFYNCSSLTALVLPDAVTSIGDHAFFGCAEIKSVNIPDGVNSIGGNAFDGCTALESVYINDLSAWCNISFGKDYSSPMYYAENLYLNGKIITGNVVLAESITAIPYGTFKNSTITGIEIPESVTAIGGNAFCGCSSLTYITVPDSVTHIGSGAFGGCSSLESIMLPFVGESGEATTASENTLFGYIFGESNCNGCTATKQYYNVNNYKTYYIPSSLCDVTITGGSLLYGALYNCSTLSDVIIGDNITLIGDNAFYNCTSLESVTIGNKVTTISSYAFSDCTSLKNVVLPNSVTSVGYSAFSGCTALASIEIADSVTYIGGYAFYNCSAEIKWGENPNITAFEDYLFDGYAGTSIIIPYSVKTVGDNAFYYCPYLINISVPYGLTAIGKNAFYNCPALAGVYITDLSAWCNISFENEYSNPLYYAEHLYLNNGIISGDIVLTESVTAVPYGTFKNSEVTSVIVPESVTFIGGNAFSGCSLLKSITLPFVGESGEATTASENTLFGYIFGTNSYSGGTAIKQYFNGNSFKTYYIPSSLCNVTITGGSLLYGAFYNCSTITNVTIGDKVNLIGEYVFYNCTSLKSVVIPENVETIGGSAFNGCPALESITLPYVGGSSEATNYSEVALFGYIFGENDYTGGTEVKQYYKDSNYKTFYIPSNLVCVTITGGNFYYGAFYNCNWLAELHIGSNVNSINDNAFYKCNSLKIYITDLSDWCSISFSSGSANPLYNGCELFLNNELVTQLAVPSDISAIADYAFYCYAKLTSVTICEGVKTIGKDTFAGCRSLTTVNLSDTITSIGYGAFASCTLLSDIIIPSGVTTIAGSAFYNCTSLKNVTIPDTVTSIGFGAFEGCKALIAVYITDLTAWCNIFFNSLYANPLYYAGNLYLNGALVKQLIISDDVTAIGDEAFQNCISLESVTIGKNVTSIGYSAFEGCTSLASIVISDSVIAIGNQAFYGCNSLERVYYNGTAYQWVSVTFSNFAANPLYYAGNLYLNGALVTDLVITEDITAIASYAFYGCTSINRVTFENTEGWYAASNSVDVTNSAQNAIYLTSTYYAYNWYRSDN